MPQRPAARLAAFLGPLVLLALLAGCGGAVATTSGALRTAVTVAPTPTASAAGIPAASARPTTAASSAPPRATVGGAAPSVPPGLAATATAVAGIAHPDASTAPVGPIAKLGDRVVVGGSAITLYAAQDNAPPGDLPPLAGSRRYNISLIIENVGTEPVLYSALFGMIILADGTDVAVTFDTYPTPLFAGGALDPGATTRGWLTFDLPKDATPARFAYDTLDGVVIYALK